MTWLGDAAFIAAHVSYTGPSGMTPRCANDLPHAATARPKKSVAGDAVPLPQIAGDLNADSPSA